MDDVDEVKSMGISHQQGQRTYQDSSARIDKVRERINDSIEGSRTHWQWQKSFFQRRQEKLGLGFLKKRL